jgi:hypothetical protein
MQDYGIKQEICSTLKKRERSDPSKIHIFMRKALNATLTELLGLY